MRLVLISAAVAIMGSASGALGCEADVRLSYNAPVELEGVLKTGTGEHEVHGAFDYAYVALDRGICVDAPEDDELAQSTPKPVDRIQIAGEAAGTELPIGKRVTVKGTLFGAHTMWHAEDVLIDAESVVAE